jgi:hypothetical protein
MDISKTMWEDIIANTLLGTGMILYFCFRDLCKRVSHSDCYYDAEHGLKMKLPTWREDTAEDAA